MILIKVDLILEVQNLVKLKVTMISRTSGNMITLESFNKEEIDWKKKLMKSKCFTNMTMSLPIM